MFSYVREVLDAIEHSETIQTREAAFREMRRLGLDDFGEILLQMPDSRFPRLSSLLPAMASVEVQNHWTGNSGMVLLRQSLNFVRSVSYNFARITGKTLEQARILDFGCGYGRIARLLYYFVDEGALHGVDPWDRSLEELKRAGFGGNFHKSDYLPERLPVEGSFDLAIAFSVFTHLSELATGKALSAIRRSMRKGGLLCITIRPVEFWDMAGLGIPEAQRMMLLEAHASKGFAFAPLGAEAELATSNYGHTSISLGYLSQLRDWRVRGIDRSFEDPHQLYVFMEAA